MHGACSTHEMSTKFWFKNLKENDHSEDEGIDGIILKSMLKTKDLGVWIGFICLKTGTRVEILLSW